MEAQPTLRQHLAWAHRQMHRLARALADLPDLAGVRLACSNHLDLKIVPLMEGLLERGAQLYATTCNPHTRSVMRSSITCVRPRDSAGHP